MVSDVPGSNYNWALKYLKLPITSVVEVGARDGLDSVALGRAFGCRVDAFEAAPEQFLVVQDNLRLSGLPDLYAHDIALLDKNAAIDFLTVDPHLYQSTGLGSVFEVNFSNRLSSDVDLGRSPIQRKVSVTAARFDSLGIPTPDLLVMDVQGAETKVLQGFGTKLADCRYVITEAERVPSYKGGNSFFSVNKFLKSEGFQIRATTIGSGTELERRLHFIKTNLSIALTERTLLPHRKYQGVFDVLYQNTRITN